MHLANLGIQGRHDGVMQGMAQAVIGFDVVHDLQWPGASSFTIARLNAHQRRALARLSINIMHIAKHLLLEACMWVGCMAMQGSPDMSLFVALLLFYPHDRTLLGSM